MRRSGGYLPGYQSALRDFARTMSNIIAPRPVEAMTALWTSVVNGAFDHDEPQFQPVKNDKGEVIFYESLSRPMDDFGTPHQILPLANLHYEHNRHIDFDLYTCTNALEKASSRGYKPISLNISVVSALNEDFFELVEHNIADYGFKPEDIVFEILEHDADPNADISYLWNLKEKGYRFALDDFNHGKKFDRLLHVFGNLVDFIKFDKDIIRDYLDRVEMDEAKPSSHRSNLVKTLVRLDGYYGAGKCVPLIAEHVHHRKEIPILKKLGFEGFQGEYSKDWDPAAKEEDALANQSLAWEYE